jgi:hypothetical protein
MEINKREIASVKSAEDGLPWYDVDVDRQTRTLRVVDDRDGSTEFDMSDVSVAIDDVDLSRPAAAGVTQDGDLIAWNRGDPSIPPLRAHLAFWDGEGTLTILDFVER